MLESALEGSRPLIEQNGHELTVSLPPDAVHLDADAVRLGQVFLNLLNNAAKFTKQGGRIWLTAARGGSDALISVRDNGIGIASDMLPRISEMFTQADRSVERSQGGLGIGLTLVRRLVDLHNGTIEARSNGPSEFVVRLPLIQPPLQAPSNPDAPKGAALSGSRILVVDDNRDSADSLGMLLRLKRNDVRSLVCTAG